MTVEQRLLPFLQKPSKRNWTALMSMLEAEPDGTEREAAIALARTHLSSWPDWLRSLPGRRPGSADPPTSGLAAPPSGDLPDAERLLSVPNLSLR